MDGAEGLKISVTDEDVAAGEALHMGPLVPDAFVSFWLECAQDRQQAETALAMISERHVGYLVVESQPLRRASDEDEIGWRAPGFSLVGCIEPAPGVSRDAFIERWHGPHREVAIATQSSFSYVRNEIVRPLTPDAPSWAAIVEEGFPIAALDDPKVFYDADGSEERYQRNLKSMMESCQAFLDLDKVDSHPMSEYRFF
jgi:hypothetical protein